MHMCIYKCVYVYTLVYIYIYNMLPTAYCNMSPCLYLASGLRAAEKRVDKSRVEKSFQLYFGKCVGVEARNSQQGICIHLYTRE